MSEFKDVIEAPKEIKTPLDTCSPSSVIKRNEYGLIYNQNISYIYDESGMIDWRAMISQKYLVPNRQLFEKNGKQVPKDITGLDDKELLILLGGIKNLASLRGFSHVDYQIQTPSPDYVVAVCSITWIPNFESEGREITFSAIGDASPQNTTSFGKYYLGPMAENRAFVRAVRNFLRINIIGADEVGAPIVGGASNPNTKMSTSVLNEIMSQYNISFEVLQKKLIDEKYIDESGNTADSYTCVDNIPTEKQFEIIERIKKRAKEKVKTVGEAQ